MNNQEWLALRLSALWRKIEVHRRLSLAVATPLEDAWSQVARDARDEEVWSLTHEYLCLDNECLQRALPQATPAEILALTRTEREAVLKARDEEVGLGEFWVLAALARFPEVTVDKAA